MSTARRPRGAPTFAEHWVPSVIRNFLPVLFLHQAHDNSVVQRALVKFP